MSEPLEQLETLSRPVVQQFIDWCIWEQARPALALILDKVMMTDLADNIRQAADLPALSAMGEQANAYVKRRRAATGPLGLSAAEAGTFEFINMVKAASEDTWDAEAIAFFASRVCGWAGWAATDFTDPMQKNSAERIARQAQAARLDELIRHESAE